MEYLNIEDEIKYFGKRYELKRKIEDMLLLKGYTHIEPSTFENFEKFISLNKKIKKESMVKVLNGGSDVLVLRPDNTTNIIKKLIPRWQEGTKLKLFYNSTVFRNNPNSNIREINQMGIEYLGETPAKADREVLGLALDILNRFNGGFILEISNSKYIRGLFEAINLDEVQEKHLKDLIYHKNKFELIAYVETLNLEKGLHDCLSSILDLQGDISNIAKKAKSYYKNRTMEEALEELKVIKNFIEEKGYSQYVHFDLSMVTELDYYDGIIFKGYYPNSFKDIISGGRYDSFTEDFGRLVPAIGFSLDLDELTEINCKKKGDAHGLS